MMGNRARPVDQASVAGVQDDERAKANLKEKSGPREMPDSDGAQMNLASAFEQTCRLHPERTAAVCGLEEISYEGLNRAADRFAHALIAMKQGGEAARNTIVAIYLDRSIAMVSAMLGVVKAGCAYLPIDPTYPAARVVQTLEDASPAVIITDRRLAAGLPPLQANILLIEETASGLDSEPERDLEPPVHSADDLAYVMYTSGSTGKPKGVLVTHRNVMRLMTETEHWFHFDENDVWTMFHSFAFDFSVWEIWGPLLTGGKLVIVPFEITRSTEEFYALLSEQRVTVLNQTPSAFSLIDQVEQAGAVLPLALRLVIFGGEALQYRALRNWFRRHGDQRPQLVNMYGITETTVHVTYRVVTEGDARNEVDSLIGEPIPDLQIHLLDPDGHPVADGEEGEICIGGGGVAREYLNRPELTAQRFVPDTFSAEGGLLYRSGDLARRRADGELVYLGRNDHQVKINGFRIELGEVEAAIAEYPGVRQVYVIAHADHTGRQRLAAYFVAESGVAITAHTLREFLSARSPAQMIPAFYIQMEQFPLTNNGKVDRKALPVPVAGSTEAVAVPASPLQERVAAIWREVLDAANVGLDDNFFDIGGSSILLIRVRAELQSQLSQQIPITWMFEFTTIRTLADKLGETEAGATAASAASASGALNAAQEQARRQREAFARMRSAKGGK
jgi:amino acid adenylation domain-containing protein